jgi:hypothetical protein
MTPYYINPTQSETIYERIGRSQYRIVKNLEGWIPYVIVTTDVFIQTSQGIVKTHRCVLLTSCPDCSSEKDEPCKSMGVQWHYVTYTHYMRREKARNLKKVNPED